MGLVGFTTIPIAVLNAYRGVAYPIWYQRLPLQCPQLCSIPLQEGKSFPEMGKFFPTANPLLNSRLDAEDLLDNW